MSTRRDEAFKVLIDLNHKRWGSDGKAFQSEEFNAFHAELCRLFDERGWLFFRLMKLDGEFVAARYDFVYGGKLWNYENGSLPELSKLSLGKLVFGYSVNICGTTGKGQRIRVCIVAKPRAVVLSQRDEFGFQQQSSC